MIIADLHIHSKYSRATSRDCVPELLDLWARRKGIGLVGTGDFTHPAWRSELAEKLIPAGEGVYALREELRQTDGTALDSARPRFVITGEISSIYKKDGRVRKVHSLILLPSLAAAENLSRRSGCCRWPPAAGTGSPPPPGRAGGSGCAPCAPGRPSCRWS